MMIGGDANVYVIMCYKTDNEYGKKYWKGDLFMEKPWRKLSCIVLVVGLCVTTHFGSVYA